MKQKKLLLFKVVLLSLIAMMLLSCQESGKVTVKISEVNNYPVLRINNSYGSDITIMPVSNETGSIGYETGKKIIWLSGMPDRTEKDGKNVRYTWINNAGEWVEIGIVTDGDKISFQMKLINGIDPAKPSKWFVNIKATDEEYFTGVLERVVDGVQGNSWKPGIETALNLRNEIVEMKVKPTVAAYAPFYLSSNNYGLFVEGTWPGKFDFCKSDSNIIHIAFEGAAMSFKLYLADAPKKIVQQHALETGPSFVAPRWAFGPWRWRDEHNNTKTYYDGSDVKTPYNSEIVEDILMMQAYDIPCTAYWIDRPWGPGSFGYDDFEIDNERLPAFENMISWLNKKDIELMLWICPWAYGKMADVANEKGYGLVEKKRSPAIGRSNTQVNRPMREEQNMVVMDFTNPEAARWWGENGPARLAKMGVKGFKLDRADGEKEGDSIDLVTHTGISYRENFNNYNHQFVKATYDAVKPVLGNDFVLFPRAQYTGSARYGAMWAGDTYSSAEGLRSVLIGMQRCAVMGYPLWSSDGGGYSGLIDHEVTMRWIGFSCFSPIMEIGPTNNKGFWNMNTEPSFDHELMAVWRFYAKLRMSLIDYAYNMAKIAGETGMPVSRPLFLEYPEQIESWKNWETYKFGDDLLVSVVWKKGQTRQRIYLPANEIWIDLWNNREYKGGKYIEVDAPVYKIPVFLRKGSTLKLPDLSILYKESVERTSVRYKMNELETKEGW